MINPPEGFKPNPHIIDRVLIAIDPGLPWTMRMDALDTARESDPAATIGALVGLIHGILDAIEIRTHGLTTGQDIYEELAAGIRHRLHPTD